MIAPKVREMVKAAAIGRIASKGFTVKQAQFIYDRFMDKLSMGTNVAGMMGSAVTGPGKVNGGAFQAPMAQGGIKSIMNKGKSQTTKTEGGMEVDQEQMQAAQQAQKRDPRNLFSYQPPTAMEVATDALKNVGSDNLNKQAAAIVKMLGINNG